jgi:ligand-binding sensor domain-containing protein
MLPALAVALRLFTATDDVRALATTADGALVEATTGGLVVDGRLVRPGAARALLVEGASILYATDEGVRRLGEDGPVSSARAGALSRFRGALVAGAPEGFPRRERVTALAELDGALYVGTLGQGLYRWDGRRAARVAGVDALVWDIRADAAGAWVATADGLARLDRRGRRVANPAATASRKLPVADVRVVRVLDDGRPVAGTYGGGAWRWDGAAWRALGPSDLRVQALALRRGGAVSLGTPAGVVDVAADGRTARPRRDGIPANDLAAVAAAPDGGAWVGTFDRGLFRVDAAGRVVAVYTERDGLLDDRVNALAIAPDGDLYIATERGLGVRRAGGGFDAIEPVGTHVATVAVAGGKVYAGTSKGLLALAGGRLACVDGFPFRRVTAIAPLAADDGLPRYVGTAEGLAVRAGGAWRAIRAAAGALPDDWITALAPLPGGAAIAGTYNAGLAWVFPDGRVATVPGATGSWVNPGALAVAGGRVLVGTLEAGLWIDGIRVSGLPDDVTGIAESAAGGLWIATRGGLARLDFAR